MKNRLFRLLITGICAFLCSIVMPIFAYAFEPVHSYPKLPFISQQSHLQEEQISSLLKESQTLQASGRYRQACSLLLQALEISQFDCKQLISEETSKEEIEKVISFSFTPLRITALTNLGELFRVVGALKSSEIFLTQTLQMAKTEPIFSEQISGLYFSLANLKRALGKREYDLDKKPDNYYNEALEAYGNALQTARSDFNKLRIKLNQFSLAVEAPNNLNLSQMAQELKAEIDKLPPSLESAYIQIDFAQSLACQNLPSLEKQDVAPIAPVARLCNSSRVKNAQFESLKSDWEYTGKLLISAGQQAKKLGDEKLESYALGYLGELYEVTGDFTQAKTVTEKALYLAQKNLAWDIAYRWQWQLGRLAIKQKQAQEIAISFYEQSVKNIEALRKDLLGLNAEVQFSFRDNVEPVYREFVELLLTPSSPDGIPSQENLQKAIQQIDTLQLSELENFLRCDLSKSVSIYEIDPDPNAAIIYPIILENRFAVILQLPDKPLEYRQQIIPIKTVETIVKNLRSYLENPSDTPDVNGESEKLYKWIYEPIEPLIIANNPKIETLVFVLDGLLRNIPMSVLYDGERYLVEKDYALAVAPRLKLFEPKRLEVQQLKVFVGGVGEGQNIGDRTFERIEKLREELDKVVEKMKANPPLLDKEFTEANFLQQLKDGNFSAVHIKTHGEFSSNLEETFIVAYNELVTAKDFANIIETGNKGKSNNIELLVLSACKTAEGDNRAVLGLAGIAVRAGARSTLSTLWKADDRVNTELMSKFYDELAKPGMTRAKALHNAQKEVANTDTTPHLWAPYVLVGNWL